MLNRAGRQPPHTAIPESSRHSLRLTMRRLCLTRRTFSHPAALDWRMAMGSTRLALPHATLPRRDT